MKPKVTVIGAGNVGAQCAYRLAQKEIAEVFPPRGESVVSTSGFEEIKAHLRRLQQGDGFYEPGEGGGPRLRRRTVEVGERRE